MKLKLFCFIITAAVMSTMGIKEYVPVVTRQTLTKDDWSEIEKTQNLFRGSYRYDGDEGIINQYIRDKNKKSWDAWLAAEKEELLKAQKLVGKKNAPKAIEGATKIQRAFRENREKLALRSAAAKAAAAKPKVSLLKPSTWRNPFKGR